MRAMEELKRLLCQELEEIAEKGEINAGSLEIVHKMTDTIKNLDKIMLLEEGGYSQRRYSRDDGWEAKGIFGRSYDDGGNSYARRGMHYVRGHYSREDGRGRLTAELEDMIKNSSGNDREIIQKALEEIRNA